MRTRERSHPYVACDLSGLLLVLAFAPVGWPWCGWVALVPAWLALRSNSIVQQRPIRYGYCLGLIFVAGSFWWVGEAAPMGFVIMLGVLSFYPALWFLLVARLLPVREPGPFRFLRLMGTALLAAAFWVALEEVRGWFLTGFNWNELGVSQTPNATIRQLAALGGVPLLSFVLVAFNILLAEAVRTVTSRSKDRAAQAWSPILAAILLATCAWLYGKHHLQRHQGEPATHFISYACIQPNIAQIPYATIFPWEIPPREIKSYQVEEKLSSIAIPSRPDLLLWPEAITAQRLGLDYLVNQMVTRITQHFPGDFLLGAEEFNQGKLYTGAYLASPGAPIQCYRKRHLVVMAEYFPFADRFPWLLNLCGGIDFTPGNGPTYLTMSHGGPSFAPFICFEETQPGLVSDAAQLHPDFFVTLTNDDWFSGVTTRWVVNQQLQNALLRTVEYDRPLVRCANNGISCEIDPDGNIVALIQNQAGETANVQGVLSRNLALRLPHITIYERYGDWVGLLCQIITLIIGLFFLLKSKVRLT